MIYNNLGAPAFINMEKSNVRIGKNPEPSA
jgi:hypothetical protein